MEEENRRKPAIASFPRKCPFKWYVHEVVRSWEARVKKKSVLGGCPSNHPMSSVVASCETHLFIKRVVARQLTDI